MGTTGTYGPTTIARTAFTTSEGSSMPSGSAAAVRSDTRVTSNAVATAGAPKIGGGGNGEAFVSMAEGGHCGGL
jgi:hypothetical protein